jgi:ribonuclease T1
MPDATQGDADNRRARLTASAGLWIGVVALVVLAVYLDRSGLLPALDEPPLEAPPETEPADQRADDQQNFPAPDGAAEKHHSRQHREGTRPQGETPPDEAAANGSYRLENVAIRDLDGRVEFRGTVDLGPTLGRIERGDRLRFAHDGSKFSNREGRLPHKPAGYYHEYVHPTPGISGPGPQRIIVGRQGETYYTSDHYRNFRRIK